MYDLIIIWHDFCEQNVKEILRATGITLDAAIEILKMYQCTPSLEIKLLKNIIELHPTPEQVDKIKEVYNNEPMSYSCIKGDKFNIRR